VKIIHKKNNEISGKTELGNLDKLKNNWEKTKSKLCKNRTLLKIKIKLKFRILSKKWKKSQNHKSQNISKLEKKREIKKSHKSEKLVKVRTLQKLTW